MARTFDSSKSALWTERLKRFEASSLMLARFCGKEGYSTAVFYQWRKKLRKPSSPKRKTTNSNPAALQQRLNNNPGIDPQIPNVQQSDENEAQKQRQQEE